MKKFNKIIAVLIVISLLSSFAVFASAAEYPAGDFQMRYTNKDGKQITSANAGDVIDVYIAINTADRYVSAFQADIMYDVAKVTQIRQNGTAVASVNAKNCRELLGDMNDAATYIDDMNDPWVQYDDENDAWGGYYLTGFGTFTATPHTVNLYPKTWDDAKKEAYKCCRFSYITNYTDATLAVYTNNEYVDFVRFRFYANEDIETLDSSVIGWSDGAAFIMNTDPNNIGLSVYMSGYDVMPVTTSYVEAPAQLVYHVKNQVQWNDQAASSVNIGVVAGFDYADIPIEFDGDNVSTNVTAVGADFAINGVSQPGKTTTRVYMVNSGEKYYFRIVLGNISTTTTDTYTVTPYVVYDGQTYYAEAVTITPDDVATLAAKLA